MNALEREQREEDGQVVGEQREGGTEEVGRENEGKGERERRQLPERRRAAQQAHQRERGAVGDRDVEQPQLPELEAHELSPAGHDQVEQRGLGGWIIREIQSLPEELDGGHLIHGCVGAMESVDLNGEALENGHSH